jgi:hypothetical protein
MITRHSCFDVTLYWMVSFPFKRMMLASPAVTWWTGRSVIAATSADSVLVDAGGADPVHVDLQPQSYHPGYERHHRTDILGRGGSQRIPGIGARR